MRKRLALIVMSLSAAALLLPVTPASATTCYLGEPDVGDVYCLIYGTPGANQVCAKTVVC